MKKQLLTAAVILSACTAGAQVSAYGFTQTSGTYGSVLSGTYIGDPAGFAEVNPVALPFNFTFNNTTYSSVDICSSGFLGFASPTGFETNPISDGFTSEIISPLGGMLWKGLVTTGDITMGSNTITNVSFPGGLAVGDSLQDLNGDFNSPVFKITQISGSTIVINTTAGFTDSGVDLFVLNGAIRENVSGTTPNRVYTVEYRNFNRLVYDEMLTFKVRLYETSNKIDFVYGPMNVGADDVPMEVGLKGSGSDYKSRLVDNSNTWATSAAASSMSDMADFGPLQYPASGQTYIWAPGCVAPSVAIVPGQTLSCPGEPIVLMAGGSATTFSWTGGLGSSPQITVTPNSTTTYTLVGTASGCTAQGVYTHSVAPTPTVSINSSTTTVCVGSQATLTASGANSYTWVNMGNNTTQTVAPTVPSTYTLIGEQNGCTDEDVVTINTNQLPVIQVTQSKGIICWNFNETSTLTASGASSYNWSNGSLTAVVVVSPTIQTTYTVTGIGANGCTNTQTITQNSQFCGGVSEASRLELVSAFPNPFHTNLTLKNESADQISVRIYDLTGRNVYESSQVTGELRVSTETWAAGVYFVEARYDGHMHTLKMVKQ